MNYRRHEIMMKSVEIATESETGWLIRIGLRDNDLIVWRTAPVNSAGIDHHREFVRPRPRQLAFCGQLSLSFVPVPQFFTIGFCCEEQISALPELALRKLLENFQAVLHHADVDSRHKLLAYAAHRQGT